LKNALLVLDDRQQYHWLGDVSKPVEAQDSKVLELMEDSGQILESVPVDAKLFKIGELCDAALVLAK
jgi:hypothetical protein